MPDSSWVMGFAVAYGTITVLELVIGVLQWTRGRDYQRGFEAGKKEPPDAR